MVTFMRERVLPAEAEYLAYRRAAALMATSSRRSWRN